VGVPGGLTEWCSGYAVLGRIRQRLFGIWDWFLEAAKVSVWWAGGVVRMDEPLGRLDVRRWVDTKRWCAGAHQSHPVGDHRGGGLGCQWGLVPANAPG
jgi:hypothetical protein